MPLTPESQKIVEARAASGLPEVWEAPVPVLRRNNHAGIAIIGTPEPIFRIDHRFIPGPTADLPIRVYRPSDAPNLPALIYIHGGGWVQGTMDGSEQTVRSLANKANVIVVAVGYQKAPEHPFPTPFDDCYATAAWVFENAGALGIDPTRIGIGGASAGANLASAVALKARDTGDFALAFQMLIVPCNDDRMEYQSAVENASGYLLSTRAMKWFWEQYLQNPGDRENPYAVPIKATTFEGLAPAIIITSEYDPLKDDGFNYAEKLRAAGVPTTYREFPGVLHGVIQSAAMTPETFEVQQYLADEMAKIVNRNRI